MNPLRLARPVARRILPTDLRLRWADKIARSALGRLDREVDSEMRVIETELAMTVGESWHEFRPAEATRRMSERVVEVPWVLSRYNGQMPVLDIGTSSAHPRYISCLRAIRGADVYGVDIRPMRIEGIHMTVGDVRSLPFRDRTFGCIFCISTIEHVGLDNSGWGVWSSSESTGDVRALRELIRVLTPGGSLLVTAPFGVAGSFKWYRQYDWPTWQDFVTQAGVRPTEVAVYSLTDTGWHVSPPSTAPASLYQSSGARGATGVVCAHFRAPN